MLRGAFAKFEGGPAVLFIKQFAEKDPKWKRILGILHKNARRSARGD
jgi:hypothetical protein